jgi:hypothetical protein
MRPAARFAANLLISRRFGDFYGAGRDNNCLPTAGVKSRVTRSDPKARTASQLFERTFLAETIRAVISQAFVLPRCACEALILPDTQMPDAVRNN